MRVGCDGYSCHYHQSGLFQKGFILFTDSVQECPRNCHGNGECVSGVCHCFPGFHGMDCSKGKKHSNYTPNSVVQRERESMRKKKNSDREREVSFYFPVTHSKMESDPLILYLKGQFKKKKIILSSFTNIYVVPQPHDFILWKTILLCHMDYFTFIYFYVLIWFSVPHRFLSSLHFLRQ